MVLNKFKNSKLLVCNCCFIIYAWYILYTIHDSVATHCIIIINVAIQVSITNYAVDSSTLINIYFASVVLFLSSIPSGRAKHGSRQKCAKK